MHLPTPNKESSNDLADWNHDMAARWLSVMQGDASTTEERRARRGGGRNHSAYIIFALVYASRHDLTER